VDYRTKQSLVLSCANLLCVAGSGDGRVSVYLNRLTGFDHQCRVRYIIVLGDNDRRLDSGIVDDVSDTDGKGYGWHPRTRFSDLVYKVGEKTLALSILRSHSREF
jgi:hypothetical protein